MKMLTASAPRKFLRRILVPIDFSALSYEALTYAGGLARTFAAQLHLVFVYDSAILSIFTPYEIVLRLQRVAQVRLGKTIAPNECHVREGPAVEEIADLAKAIDADVIVLARDGGDALKHFMHGSTTEKILRRAVCAVLIVPCGWTASQADARSRATD